MTEIRAQRRLAAILAADVVGYSRLMEQDEAGTLAALKARRQDVLAPPVARHNLCGTITDRSRMNPDQTHVQSNSSTRHAANDPKFLTSVQR
jgi:hypothetical protein